MENHVFIKGLIKDVEEIYLLIKKRINWMDDNGIKQWNKTNYLSSYPKGYFEEKAKSGQLYVMKDKGSDKVVGAVVLLEEDERWDLDCSNSYYIHNLVSDTEFPGVGKKIIQSCEKIANKQGKDSIRLDCQATNSKINNFYNEIGYKYVENFKEGTYVGNKREKVLIRNMDKTIS
jgi:ribosomal protein S18 acetylase RimI-like enzyme